MSFTCNLLASFLLIFIFSTQGADPPTITVQGILDHDVHLDITDLLTGGTMDDIRWKKGDNKIAQYQTGNIPRQLQEKYQVLANGTLKIKHLDRNDSGTYKATVYDKNGIHILETIFDLKLLERVSKPVISWNCTNATLICKVMQGTDPNLRLFRNGNSSKEGRMVITYKWTNLDAVFKCVASNEVSVETSTVTVNCSGLDIYLIAGVCGGGTLSLVFLALLVLYVSKTKQQSLRTNGEEMESQVHRITPEERSRHPPRIPYSAPQNPAAAQAPPPPGHRSQAPSHRPPPPGHRAQHQQHQKRPLPQPGTQARQHKGPPLPRPRVQPKSPRGATENS